MPELPDLEVFKENLSKKLVNKKVIQLNDFKNKKVIGINAYIDKIDRRGKEILIHFSNDNILSIHLMLHGGFHLTRIEDNNLPSSVFCLEFEDRFLYIIDKLKVAKYEFNKVYDESIIDALDFERYYIEKKLQEYPNLPIKQFLINQNILLGIGNSYADEILYDLKIHPSSIVSKITKENFSMGLVDSIKNVLLLGYQNIKKTSPNIISGEVRKHLLIHNKKKTLSPGNKTIIKEKINSKVTYYTEEQILYK